jgi:hypothetical protein
LGSPKGSEGQRVVLKAQSQQLEPTYVQQQPLYFRQPTPSISPVRGPEKGFHRVNTQGVNTQGVNTQELGEEEEAEEQYPSDVNKTTQLLNNFKSFLIQQPNPQYNFSFDVKDDELTNYQNRQEEREGGVIKGSYSVVSQTFNKPQFLFKFTICEG